MRCSLVPPQNWPPPLRLSLSGITASNHVAGSRKRLGGQPLERAMVTMLASMSCRKTAVMPLAWPLWIVTDSALLNCQGMVGRAGTARRTVAEDRARPCLPPTGRTARPGRTDRRPRPKGRAPHLHRTAPSCRRPRGRPGHTQVHQRDHRRPHRRFGQGACHPARHPRGTAAMPAEDAE